MSSRLGAIASRLARSAAPAAAALMVLPLAAVGPLPPAAAAPGDGAARLAPGDEFDPSTAGEDMPLTITVTQLDPRTVTPESTIVVAGTVTNETDVAITDLIIRLQRGPALSLRDELRGNDAEPSSSTSGFAPFLDLLDDLDAGDTAPFRYETTAEVLGLAELGVYPLMVNVNGIPDGDVEQRVGQLDTYLPFFPAATEAATGVSWLWPLVDQPHRGPDGRFTDDELAVTVSRGGRLDRMLSLAEASPQVPLTLAVDPLLLETLQAMVAGYQLPDGGLGSGGPAAADWLGRLAALTRTRDVIALPYADADIVALTRSGLAGPAQDAVERAAQVVRDILDTEPVAGLAWPVDGAVTEAALAVLRDAGARQLVLAADAVDRSDGFARTPSAAATVGSPDGDITALVSDPVLDGIVAAADSWPSGPRLAEQRYLAELAVITAEAPAAARDLLVLPPRRWDPRTSYALPMLIDTASEPWLRPVEATSLGDLPTTDRGGLVYPAEAGAEELDVAGMADLADAVGSIGDFESMLVLDSPEEEQAGRTLTDPMDSAVLVAASSYRRGDPEGLRVAARAVRQAVDAQRQRVFLIVPADGTYSLASARASLVFTVENQLPVPVRVTISVDSSLVAGLSTEDVGAQLLAPAGRTLIEVPATVERPGTFRVTSVIATPSGGTLGAPVRLTVRSTVYGGIALVITIAAGALLLLLFALRLIRRLRNGPSAREPAPEPLEPARLQAVAAAELSQRSADSRAGARSSGT